MITHWLIDDNIWRYCWCYLVNTNTVPLPTLFLQLNGTQSLLELKERFTTCISFQLVNTYSGIWVPPSSLPQGGANCNCSERKFGENHTIRHLINTHSQTHLYIQYSTFSMSICTRISIISSKRELKYGSKLTTYVLYTRDTYLWEIYLSFPSWARYIFHTSYRPLDLHVGSVVFASSTV